MSQEYEDSYHAAARRLAINRRLTPEQFIDEAGERLEAYDYPTANCLLPEDIVAFGVTGKLLDQQRSHAGACHFCRELLDALTPPQEQINAFRSVVATPRKTPEFGLPLRSPLAGSRGSPSAITWGAWGPATVIAGFLCLLIAGWIVLTLNSKSEASGLDPVGVETLSQSILLSPDVLAISKRSTSTSDKALREYLKRPTAQAYTRVVSIDSEPSREIQFRRMLLHELGHVIVADGTSPSVQVVRYRDVEAQINCVRLFDKLDEQRAYVLSTRRE